jgi:integrase
MMTTVAEAVDDWCAHRRKLVELNLLRETTCNNQSKIAAGLKAHFGATPLAALRKSHIELWAGARLRFCASITVQGELNVLKQIINWCVDEDLLARKPRLPTIQVERTEAALPQDEAFRWHLAHLAEETAQALEFMMLTGLSPHELERLEKRDFSRPKGAVTIGGRDDFPVKQASRRREVPLCDRALTIWNQRTIGARADYKPFPTISSIQRSMRRLVLRSLTGMPPEAADVTPKMMRKWFASKVASQQPEHVLQKLLGHSPGSPVTRRHYVRSADEQLVAAVKGLCA